MHTSLLKGLAGSLAGALCLSTMLMAAAPSPVADAAMQHDRDTVRTLLKRGGDVNGAQGDGMTALHWAALHNDADLTSMLLYAGANHRGTTRLGSYTALHLASQNGAALVVATLLGGGANANARTATGATPLMLAAGSGRVEAVTRLLDGGAEIDARETTYEQTALMFAAAFDRVDVVTALMARGADATLASKFADLTALTAPAEPDRRPAPPSPAPVRSAGAPAAENVREDTTGRNPTPAELALAAGKAAAARAAAAPPPRREDVAGSTRNFRYNELVGTQGGLTALHFAARQGSVLAVRALVEHGAKVNQVSPGDHTTPLLIATINGHFDVAWYLIEKGADASLASAAGATPLYAVLNVQWAPKAAYPQPRAYLQQQHSYLDLMTALLDRGADPNARVTRKIWYSSYNFDQSNVDEVGATPFWRAAYASDVDAMRLLVSRGADVSIPTSKPAGRPRFADSEGDIQDVSGLAPLPAGGPGIPPLQAVAGVGYGKGFAGNSHTFAPGGMMPAVKYLVEELGADVNAVDHEGNTALHHAASRGDNEMINYLVAQGADATKVNRAGQSTVDLANGPVQRVQPFPETIALLEKLGAKNNHKCVSC